MMSASWRATRLATRLAFFVAGFGMAGWAPLVPFVKERLAVDDGVLGFLLLLLGIGSVVAMLLTGLLSARCGSKPIILAGGFGVALLLPWLAVFSTPAALGAALVGFGASLGSISVSANIYAVEAERAAKRPLMSGFHAQFSIGEFVGSAAMTTLLWLDIEAFSSTLICSIIVVCAMMLIWPRLPRSAQAQHGALFVVPRAIVLLLAALAGIMFLIEGAMLDWSALLLVERGLVPKAQGGLGFMLFSIAMTAGRLGGDSVVARLGDRTTLVLGSLLAVAGFALLLCATSATFAIAGFLLIGLGASNLVPILFRRAGAQKVMPRGLAIAAITAVGYAGILVGPAGVGFLAKLAGLPIAFAILAALMCLVTLSARSVTMETR
ncbi:MFS transporter [Bradyrhizobium septentrionale]|uniref:MFS transporter n=1 Tax=Bradyrhizobium septentrionale TaxID=1404411 RepID=A0A973VX79_9BRAD|nr:MULTISPECIES: MFS transporter [Bradyrhizobium]MCK7672525.1 MFS transporter [Bradyrhizobium sp. 2S1]UGY12273.1 MFS transporter [Bradyrhizobium septentrionale]UGY25608.1 MFS transporter [Bradyrhizobium septentrionale]